MNDKEKRELIRHMAETLRNHTEPYKAGAWERFAAHSANRPRRSLARFGWVAAAAVLLLAAGLVWFNNSEGDIHLAQQLPGPSPSISGDMPDSTASETRPSAIIIEQGSQAPPELNSIPAQVTAMNGQTQVSPTDTNDVNARSADLVIEQYPTVHTTAGGTDTLLMAAVPDASDSAGETVSTMPGESGVETPVEAVPEQSMDQGRQSASEQQLLARESGRRTYGEAVHEGVSETSDKWNLGVVLAPSMTSERLNIGGGFAVAYRLSDKFSLASGVSLNDLGVAQQQAGRPQEQAMNMDPNAPAPGTEPNHVGPYRYREITSVTSTLLAIDVPLNLRYHVSASFYTSVGVSFLGILNERRTNHFVDHINQPTDYTNHLKAVHSAERSGEQPLQGKGYAGFVNFSVGRSVPLSSKVSISVEPYFKLPVGRLSREDMDLTNGGIRIVTGF